MTNFKKIVKANLLKSILVFFVGCFALPAFAIIDISIKNSPNTTFYLQRIKGDRLFTLDSMQIVDGQIKFSWKAPYQAGMYRVYSGENSLYFLATEEDVILETKWPQLQGNLHIVQSKENEQWFSYLSLKKQTYQHLDLLNPIITWYDKDSDFYGIALQEFQKQQAAISLWIKDQKKDSTAYLAMQIIHSDIKPELPMGLSLEEQKEFFKEHWFAHVDWYDNDLINTNILTEKITEYLGLYADRNRSKAELQMAFKYAVDQLIPQVENNDEMYAFVLDYLLRGFERFNFEEVILHIALNYPPPQEKCENEERKSEALARLGKYESMQIGHQAMDFVLPDLQEQEVRLSANEKSKILIVFWASWCPHCKVLMQEIEAWYTPEKQEIWQVYALSIDEDKQALEAFVQAENIQIPILCDYAGWNSPAVMDYNIYATPTMIVLDKDLIILDKPMKISELK